MKVAPFSSYPNEETVHFGQDELLDLEQKRPARKRRKYNAAGRKELIDICASFGITRGGVPMIPVSKKESPPEKEKEKEEEEEERKKEDKPKYLIKKEKREKRKKRKNPKYLRKGEQEEEEDDDEDEDNPKKKEKKKEKDDDDDEDKSSEEEDVGGDDEEEGEGEEEDEDEEEEEELDETEMTTLEDDLDHATPEAIEDRKRNITYVTVGMIGHPNVGKSSLINGLVGRKVVSTSSTPGHTKYLQVHNPPHHYLPLFLPPLFTTLTT